MRGFTYPSPALRERGGEPTGPAEGRPEDRLREPGEGTGRRKTLTLPRLRRGPLPLPHAGEG
jgi:hypothetical protein